MGNQAVGEAIKEPVNFLAGHTYSFEFCARFHPEVGKLSSVNIVLRASSTPLTNTKCLGNCEAITTTASITSTAWGTYTACWTAQRNESWLTISPSNGSNVNDGSQVSWGQVDDICIREVNAPVIDGPKDTCTSPATYCVKAPATGPFAWTVNNGTFQPANADGSCILVTWNQANNGGTVSVTSNVLGCKVTSVVKPHECNHPPCCKDVLKASLVSSETVSGGEQLSVALSGPSGAMTVQATVLGASHVFQPTSCGVAGPIIATASSTQPPPPAGWNAPSVPFLNGNQIVWQSIPSGGSPLGPAPFQLNLQLPGTGSMKCNDVVTVCIEFEVTFAATKDVPCRTCKIVRCFTFTRCPMCQ